MKFRVGLLLLGCGVALHAQMQMNASQLAQFLRSELALKFHTDKQIAEYLKKVTLTERLTDKEVEDLEAQGAGPKVTQALQQLEEKSQSLKPPTKSPTYSPTTAPDSSTTGGPASVQLSAKKAFPPPSSVRQAAILDQLKQYALNYTQNLPNFICTQVTRRYVDFDKSDSYISSIPRSHTSPTTKAASITRPTWSTARWWTTTGWVRWKSVVALYRTGSLAA
jgi:hypothetical protein